jgi:hypothetical protein
VDIPLLIGVVSFLICYRGRFGDMLTRLENRLKKERAARKPLVDANFFGNWNRDKMDIVEKQPRIAL